MTSIYRWRQTLLKLSSFGTWALLCVKKTLPKRPLNKSRKIYLCSREEGGQKSVPQPVWRQHMHRPHYRPCNLVVEHHLKLALRLSRCILCRTDLSGGCACWCIIDLLPHCLRKQAIWVPGQYREYVQLFRTRQKLKSVLGEWGKKGFWLVPWICLFRHNWRGSSQGTNSFFV